MNDRDRLDQLRGLLDRLERMPASADRDWMLAEVRARVVDVDTGMPPTPMRALPQDELKAENAAARSPLPEPVARVRTQRKKPGARGARATVVHAPARVTQVPARERRHEEVVDLLAHDGVMSLDESPAAEIGASRPWSGSLRG